MTFYFANILTGAAPNDGTGDPLRTAFTKINQNFNTLTPNIGNAEIRCLSLTSTYISSFNLINSDVVYSSRFGNAGTIYTGESLTVNTVTANTYVGAISTNNAVFTNISVNNTATINVATITTAGINSVAANTANISGGNINGTTIGDTNPNSATFTSVTVSSLGNINLNTGNISGVQFIVRNMLPHLGENINGNANAFSFIFNTTGSSGQYVVYNISSNTNVTSNITGTITTGIERFYMVRNQGVGSANLILPIPGGNTNKGSNVVLISGGTSAAIRFVAFGPNSQSVFAEISNN